MSDLKAIHNDGPKVNTVDRVQLSLMGVAGLFLRREEIFKKIGH